MVDFQARWCSSCAAWKATSATTGRRRCRKWKPPRCRCRPERSLTREQRWEACALRFHSSFRTSSGLWQGPLNRHQGGLARGGSHCRLLFELPRRSVRGSEIYWDCEQSVISFALYCLCEHLPLCRLSHSAYSVIALITLARSVVVGPAVCLLASLRQVKCN